MPCSLAHSLCQAQWKTSYSYGVAPLAEMLRILWQKTFHIIKCLHIRTVVLLQFKLYNGHFSMASIKGHMTGHAQGFHIT